MDHSSVKIKRGSSSQTHPGHTDVETSGKHSFPAPETGRPRLIDLLAWSSQILTRFYAPGRKNRMRHIGFGLEKIGLLALHWPRRAAVFILIVTFIALAGISQLRFDDDVIYAFRSGSDSYRHFTELLNDHDGVSNDAVILVEASQPFDAGRLRTLREMHFDLEFADGVEQVLSAFSLRELSKQGEPGPALFPDSFTDTALPEIFARIDASPLGLNRALSPDRKAMMFVVIQTIADRDAKAQRKFIKTLDQLTADYTADGITVSVLGMQKTRFEIADAILNDQITFNAAGSLVAMLVALAIFRNIRITALLLLSGSFAVIWTMGAAGLAGHTISVITNIIPVLIIVIAFTNSMHLVHGLREHVSIDNDKVPAAIASTIRRIGPACALTSLTTAAAFASLSLTGYGALAELAWFGAAAAVISFLAIISVFPLAARFMIRQRDIGTYRPSQSSSASLLGRLSASIKPNRRAIIGAAIILLAAGIAGHIFTTPRFSTYDNIPRGSAVLETSLRAEDRFGGLFNLWIRLPGEPRQMMTSNEGWQKIVAVHKAAETVLGHNAVFSPLTMARALKKPDQPLAVETLDELPPAVTSRFGKPGSKFITLSALVGDPARSKQHLARYDQLEAAVRDAGASVVTGTPALARHDAERMIVKMNISIIAAAVTSIFLVALAFRSAALIPAIALANLTPVLLTGLILHVLAAGEIKIATGLAMTIAFGVAIDDTIHVINRVLFERHSGRDVTAAIRSAITGVGFVLCATTLVLGAGISLTFLSSFYTVRLFGGLMIMILVFALLADLIILPAMLMITRRWRRGHQLT